jgi:3-oxoacyl-[acyl-carrier protein] reductase
MTQKTIIITGASSGIGAALTHALAADGHRLIVCARRADRLASVTEDGRLAHPVVCDVADPVQVRALMAEVGDRFGSVDALVHCAGIFGPIGPTHEVDPQAWTAAVGNNLFSLFYLAQGVVPLMRPERDPSMIAFSGGGAFTPLPRCSAYAVSKAGLVRLIETLAQELEPLGIMVNAIAPGFVATPIHDATLEAGPEKAGVEFYEATRRRLVSGAVPIEAPIDLVRYLLSAEARSLTGKTISANFDPWGKPAFNDAIKDITASKLYSMRRIDLRHLPPGPLRDRLDLIALPDQMDSTPKRK